MVVHRKQGKKGLSLFTDDQIRYIRAEYAAKHKNQASLAQEFKVSPMTISFIVNRVTYKEVE